MPCNPFEDPDTLKPMPDDPFTFNLNFDEIPQSFIEPQEWCDTFSSPMRISEPITILEARGLIAAVKRKCRAVRSFGKRHPHLNDNLASVLCLEKGRSSSYPMLRACRRLCALLVAANCSVHHRWVPSELNPADHASRRWEGERKARAFHEKASQAEGRLRWRPSVGSGLKQSDEFEKLNDKVSNQAVSPGRLHGLQSRKENAVDDHVLVSTVSGSEFFGADGRLNAGGPPEYLDRTTDYSLHAGIEPLQHPRGGRSEARRAPAPEHLSQQHAQARRRRFRRTQPLRSHPRRPARLFLDGDASQGQETNSACPLHVQRVPLAWGGPPCSRSSASHSDCDHALNLHPLDRYETSKTGLFDEIILLDSSGPASSSTRPSCMHGETLWCSGRPGQLCRAVPAPSHDRLLNLKSLLEVKLRGRWTSDSSVKRCEAHSKLSRS